MGHGAVTKWCIVWESKCHPKCLPTDTHQSQDSENTSTQATQGSIECMQASTTEVTKKSDEKFSEDLINMKTNYVNKVEWRIVRYAASKNKIVGKFAWRSLHYSLIDIILVNCFKLSGFSQRSKESGLKKFFEKLVEQLSDKSKRQVFLQQGNRQILQVVGVKCPRPAQEEYHLFITTVSRACIVYAASSRRSSPRKNKDKPLTRGLQTNWTKVQRRWKEVRKLVHTIK